MFELRRLRLLHELSQRGTLTAVAEALSTASSTVSQQLARAGEGCRRAPAHPRRPPGAAHRPRRAARRARGAGAQLEERVRGELEERATRERAGAARGDAVRGAADPRPRADPARRAGTGAPWSSPSCHRRRDCSSCPRDASTSSLPSSIPRTRGSTARASSERSSARTPSASPCRPATGRANCRPCVTGPGSWNPRAPRPVSGPCSSAARRASSPTCGSRSPTSRRTCGASPPGSRSACCPTSSGRASVPACAWWICPAALAGDLHRGARVIGLAPRDPRGARGAARQLRRGRTRRLSARVRWGRDRGEAAPQTRASARAQRAQTTNAQASTRRFRWVRAASTGPTRWFRRHRHGVAARGDCGVRRPGHRGRARCRGDRAGHASTGTPSSRCASSRPSCATRIRCTHLSG